MKKIIVLGLGVLTVFLFVVSAEAKTEPWVNVGEYDVDAGSSTPVPGVVMEEGYKYKVEVTGTYLAGDGIEADALCSFRDISSTEWTDLVSNYESFGEDLLDLLVNGERVWGTECDPEHMYSTIMMGDGNPVNFLINDIYYPNNSGSLHVTVYKFWKAQGKPINTCTTIQDGVLTYSSGHYLEDKPLMVGYDPYGYNYQAHMFNGSYANAYLGRDGFPPYMGDDEVYLAENPTVENHWTWDYRNDLVMMKWNEAWLSNQDCDKDRVLDRHYSYPSYIGSGAWLTNHMRGEYDEYKWNYFIKIVAAPADATNNGGVWYAADNSELGPVIWGDFATVMEVSNDQGTEEHGLLYKGDHPGFGYFMP